MTDPPAAVDPATRPLAARIVTPASLALTLAFITYALANDGSFMFFNYHVWLADAFLHGKVYLQNPPPWLTEVAFLHGHKFVFFGPVPALLLLPLVAIFHTGLNLARVCNALGAVNVALVWILLERLGCSRPVTTALCVVFAVGSVHFWESAYGNTWLWAQLCAVFFLLAATLEVLGRRRSWLIGLLLGSAALSRDSCALAFPFFAILVNHPRLDLRNTARLVGGIAVLAVFDGWYNWARFGSPFNNGYLYANQTIWHPPFGSFSWHYLLPELGAYFWRGPTFTRNFPYAVLTYHGMSLLWTTPAFVYLAGAALAFGRTRGLAELWRDRDRSIALAAWCALLPMAGLYLGYFWDGWHQFGSRYSLDYEVFILILLGLYLKDRLTWRFRILATASVLINLWGIVYWRLARW